MSKFGIAGPRCACQNGLEDRLQLAGRTGDHLQHLGGRGLLLPRLGELTGARFELLFQLDQRIGPVANARSRLRSGRTKLAAPRWAICAFERQGHLVGTVTGSPFRSAQPRIEPINPNRTAGAHSDSVIGWLNSEVAPSAYV